MSAICYSSSQAPSSAFDRALQTSAGLLLHSCTCWTLLTVVSSSMRGWLWSDNWEPRCAEHVAGLLPHRLRNGHLARLLLDEL